MSSKSSAAGFAQKLMAVGGDTAGVGGGEGNCTIGHWDRGDVAGRTGPVTARGSDTGMGWRWEVIGVLNSSGVSDSKKARRQNLVQKLMAGSGAGDKPPLEG